MKTEKLSTRTLVNKLRLPMYNCIYNSALRHRHIYDKGDARHSGVVLLFLLFLPLLVQANLLKNV